MPTISYHALNGRISSLTVGVDPNATGPSIGGRIDVLSDALGSVVRTMHDEPQNGGETIRYAGYGSVLYEAGGWAPPRSGWVGSLGYRGTQLRHAEQYVRARHYATSAGRWTTVDPLWPDESAYGYVEGNPASWIDPSGTQRPFLPPNLQYQKEDLWLQRCMGCAYAMAGAATAAGENFCQTLGHAGDMYCLEEGPGGAVRHCVWSCLMARQCGMACANYIGDQHEEVNVGAKPGSWAYRDSCMDLTNNKMGRWLYDVPGSCASLCTSSAQNGKLFFWQSFGLKSGTTNCDTYKPHPTNVKDYCPVKN